MTALPPPAARKRLQLPRLAAEHRVIAPREAGLQRLGHFGFFRPAAERPAWQPAADWLLA